MNAIKSLESLTGMLPEDKASMLLVYGGLKPSAHIVMQGVPFRSSTDTVHIKTKLVKKLDVILSELSLSSVVTYEMMVARSSDEHTMLQEVMRIYVAPSTEIANQLKVAFDHVSENHTYIGTLLGYPNTAVTAFLTTNMLDWDNHPLSTDEVSEDNMRLLGHRLSKNNWRKEVEYLERYGNFLKQVSPAIYSEITKS